MNASEAKQLKAGDVVWWDDPDSGICSRPYKIKTVHVDNGFVGIEDVSGDYLECFARELSLTTVPRKFKVKISWTMEGEVEVEAYSKGHAIIEAVNAPLPSSDTWSYVPDSCVVVNPSGDVQEVK